MIKTQVKSIEQEVIIDIICDGCGKTCMFEFAKDSYTAEYATLKANWGYFSKSDGEKIDKQYCEKCTKLLIWLLEKYFQENEKANKDLINYLLNKDMGE